jgi:hypothetical protein
VSNVVKDRASSAAIASSPGTAGDARLYHLVHVGRDITQTDAEAKAFFDSFELI